MDQHRLLIHRPRCAGFPFGIGFRIAAIAALTVVCLAGDSGAQVVPNNPRVPNWQKDLFRNQHQNPNREAEQNPEDTFIQRDQSVFVPAPRELLRPLIRANRAIRENDIPRAVSLLGEVLNDAMTEDFLVPLSDPEGVSVSLRLKAQAILGSLPPKDRQLYRLRYGVQAKQMLEQAIEESDFERVSQVMQRFFYTDAGFDAAMLLGHYHLDQGRPIAAANCFQRVVDSEEAQSVHDPEASVLLATCWMLGDSPARATDALVNLRARSPKKTIQFLGKPVRLFDRPEDASGWLLKLIGESPFRKIALVNQWIMVGGNPQRNARSGMGFPLLNPRWVTPTMNNPDLEKSVLERQRELIVMDSAPIPAVQPLAIGNTIVMRAFDKMIGVDFETGKRIWVFPPWDFTNRIDGPNNRLQSRVINKTPLTERMWLDAVYGQASSDGQTIFVVPKPGFSAQARTPISSDAEPTLTRTFNELMAIDIAREGAFKWEVGGEAGLDEPQLAKSFFLGAPLPLADELFAVCQQGTEIRLVALDAQTGKLKWHQQIGTTETSAIKLLHDRYRRLAGVTPSFANGILVCSTGNGALVAVDVSTRSLLWGYQYMTPGRKAVQPISPGRSSNSDPLDGLWRDSAILIADGKVLFTPVDAQDLVCVDLQSGFPTWNSPNGLSAKTNRKDSMFLACVENGLAILVGETSVRAISVETGEQVWEQPTVELGKPSGRGYANHGYYYFPTTREKLVQINLETGEIAKTVDTQGVLGNLICYRGDVISHGVDRLACFPQDAPNRKLVASAAAAGKLTPELLAVRAQLQMQDGRFREAVNSIQEAYLQQPNRAYENLLLEWLIRLLEEDFDYGIDLAKHHEDQLLANRRLEFLAAKINGMMHNDHAEAAVEELFNMLVPILELEDQGLDDLEIATFKHDRNLIADDNSPKRSGAQQERITIRLDRWIGSRIKLLHEQGPADLKALIETRIGELAVAKKDLAAVDRYDLLRIFPKKLVPEETRVELARALLDEGNSLRAMEMLEALDSGDPRLAAMATAEVANEYLRKKMFNRARESIEKLETEFAGVILSGNQKVGEIAQALRKEVQGETGQPPKWNSGSIRVTTARDTQNKLNSLIPSPIKLEEFDSAVYADYKYQFFGQTGELEILDGNGNSVFRFLARARPQPLYLAYSNYVFGRISIKNNLALVDISTEIFAFDWLKLQQGIDPVLWNLSIAGERDPSINSAARLWKEIRTTATPRNYENRVFVSAPGFDGICYLDRTNLVCVDPFTGEKYWQRSNLPPNCKLLGDSKHVIVWDSLAREALILETSDGRLAGTTRLAPEVGTIWQSLGCKILVSTISQTQPTPSKPPAKKEQETNGEDKIETEQLTRKAMGLYDLLEAEFVWKADYAMDTLACRVGRDRIAVFSPDKDLEFINVQNGKVELRTPVGLDLAERALINGIGVAINQGNYLIHFKRGDSPSRVSIDSRNIRIRPLSYSDRLWVGSLMCVDSTTGKNLWEKAVRFDNFQLGPSQPMNTPIYLLVRNVTKEDESGMSMTYVQFVGIDLKSGKLATNYMHLNNGRIRRPFRISCDAESQQLTIESSGNQIKFELVEDLDSPPRPVTHLTNHNSIPTVTIRRQEATVDREMIEVERQKSLQKAIAAQKLLPQKRAEEKKQLEAEQTIPNDK